jgi:hypothetical protein
LSAVIAGMPTEETTRDLLYRVLACGVSVWLIRYKKGLVGGD